MYPMVRASLTGSIIGNVLLVLGLAVLAGGLVHKRQTFNRTAAGLGSTLLALACIGLLVPTVFYYLFRTGPAAAPDEAGLQTVQNLSEEIAIILAVIYGLSLLFSLHTHQQLVAGEDKGGGGHGPAWSRRTALIVLLAATAGVALMSEFLVGAV